MLQATPPSSLCTSHGMPIVFVVDDDASVRESLESLIASAGWHPETYASAMEFLLRPRPISPSCLVLDVRLPGLDGLELQTRITAERLDVPIIFVTAYGDVPMTVRAMKAGAIDFLTKPFADEVLLEAIGRALDQSRAALDHAADMHILRERHASLSRREREVMELVVAGWLNKQVAVELGISEVTVKAHRCRTMQKMEARSLAHLINMAAKLVADPCSGTRAQFAADAPSIRSGLRRVTRAGSGARVYSASRPF